MKPHRAYHKLIEQHIPAAGKCHSKWQDELSTPEIEWSQVYERLHWVTSDVNLKWFRYRLIRRIFPTNRLLYYYGIIESDKCHACPLVSEILKHKFYDWPSVKAIWHGVRNILGLQNNLSYLSIVLGTKSSNEKQSRQTSLITILASQFIWKEKYRSQCIRLTYLNLKKYIRQYLDIEKYIAKISGREQDFHVMWGTIYEKTNQ